MKTKEQSQTEELERLKLQLERAIELLERWVLIHGDQKLFEKAPEAIVETLHFLRSGG